MESQHTWAEMIKQYKCFWTFCAIILPVIVCKWFQKCVVGGLASMLPINENVSYMFIILFTLPSHVKARYLQLPSPFTGVPLRMYLSFEKCEINSQ